MKVNLMQKGWKICAIDIDDVRASSFSFILFQDKKTEKKLKLAEVPLCLRCPGYHICNKSE